MMKPIFYKAKRFYPDRKFSEIYNERTEIVSYDMCLCGVIFKHDDLFVEKEAASKYAGEVANWLSLLKEPLNTDEQIIAYYKNPCESYECHELEEGFEFCGYDLSEEMTGISAVTNCGNLFDKAIPYEKLNKFGLIAEYHEAFRIRKLLDELYPDESHAECEVYELWRRL